METALSDVRIQEIARYLRGEGALSASVAVLRGPPITVYADGSTSPESSGTLPTSIESKST